MWKIFIMVLVKEWNNVQAEWEALLGRHVPKWLCQLYYILVLPLAIVAFWIAVPVTHVIVKFKLRRFNKMMGSL